jgi:hypothetical protein
MLDQRSDSEIDIARRCDRAQELRAIVVQPLALAACARQLLAEIPPSCEYLVAFSVEGYAVGAATSALSAADGRLVHLLRASHIAPLSPHPESRSWSWMNVEEALGLGPPRSWVVAWSRERGGAPPLSPASSPGLAEVA